MLLESLIARCVLRLVRRYQTVERRPGDLLKTQGRLGKLEKHFHVSGIPET